MTQFKITSTHPTKHDYTETVWAISARVAASDSDCSQPDSMTYIGRDRYEGFGGRIFHVVEVDS